MFGLLTAALLSAGLGPTEAEPEPLLAINPNISVGVCSGGTPIAGSPGMSERTVAGALFGADSAVEAFGIHCTGYYESEAHFCISIPAPGGYYNIELIDAEGIDTTIAVVGDRLPMPLCDDDSGTRGHSLLSRVNAWFDGGEYLIYVGS